MAQGYNITEKQKAKILELKRLGVSSLEIAERFELTVWSVNRVIAAGASHASP